MLLRLLFSSVVMISRARDFSMLLHVKMENLFLLLPCLAQKDFRSFFYCAVLHKSSSIAGCEERLTFFFKCGSDSGVLFWCVSSLTGCGCCSSIWWSDEGDLGSCRFSSRFTSSCRHLCYTFPPHSHWIVFQAQLGKWQGMYVCTELWLIWSTPTVESSVMATCHCDS